MNICSILQKIAMVGSNFCPITKSKNHKKIWRLKKFAKKAKFRQIWSYCVGVQLISINQHGPVFADDVPLKSGDKIYFQKIAASIHSTVTLISRHQNARFNELNFWKTKNNLWIKTCRNCFWFWKSFWS